MVVVMPLSSRKSKRSRSIVPITLRNSRRRSRFASVSLLGVELLFLRRKPSRFNQRQIATWLTATPACWSSLSCNCASVRSGSLAIQANRCWRCSSPTAALRPGRCTRRSIDPVRVWAAEIFLAQPRLTRKSSASSSSVPSPFSYAVRNFRCKSSPYAFAILACRRRTAKHCLHYLLKRSKVMPEARSSQEFLRLESHSAAELPESYRPAIDSPQKIAQGMGGLVVHLHVWPRSFEVAGWQRGSWSSRSHTQCHASVRC